jgi:DNA-binding transcriptional MerR regulator
MDEKQLQDLIDSLKKISGSPREQQQKLRVEAERLVKQQKTNKELQRFISDLKDRASKDKEARRKVQDLSEAIEDNVEQHKKYRDTLKKVGSSVVGLGRAATAGEGSISSFTDNFRGLGVIGDSFAFLGNRLDTNIETFRQLSQIGATFGQSIVELRQTAATAALPLDDFAALVRQNSEGLAALFGSTTQGAKGIALLGEAVRTQGIDRLAPLGFTIDEVNETLLLNLDRQRRTNIFSRLTDDQRTASAIRFAEELDRLARLTGAQRDELRAQIEQQQSNAKFQAFLQGATDGARTRLEGFAASIGTIAPGLNDGFQDLIANAGVPVTEASLALVQNIPQASQVVRDLISGAVTSEQALSTLRTAAGASVDRFRKATVTGQVEFLALQGDVINLARRITDVDSIFAEQGRFRLRPRPSPHRRS